MVRPRESFGDFKYHVGISSLAQIASRGDRPPQPGPGLAMWIGARTSETTFPYRRNRAPEALSGLRM